jgi:soluble lytic murein transglycosylase-like protein
LRHPADHVIVRTGLKMRIAAGLAAAGLFLLLPAAGDAAGFSAKLKEKYNDLVETISLECGLENDFVHAVIKHESAYNRYAISRAGAQGLMQLMPATAAAFGVKDVFDPEENIRGGAKFLKSLLILYHWDKKMALAAYNAGQEAVKKWGGIPPYPETQTYIRRVMASFKEISIPGRTKIYEFKDANGKTIVTNDPRMVAQFGVVNPN